MISPLRLLGSRTPPHISLGKAEAEWALAAYLSAAQRIERWCIPFAEVVHEQTGLPRSTDIPTMMTRREQTGFRKMALLIKDDRVKDMTPPARYIVDVELGLTIAELQGFIVLKDISGVTYLDATDKLVKTLIKAVCA